jgi:hypothetical protein
MATTDNSELYERDFFEWTQATATALRTGDLDAIARDALAEEIEHMGRRDLREVRSRAIVLIVQCSNGSSSPSCVAAPGWLPSTCSDRISPLFSSRALASSANSARLSLRSTARALDKP